MKDGINMASIEKNNMIKPKPVIRCSKIYKSFRVRGRRIDVLKGVDLEVYPGEIVVIKGRSGEGKSVLQWIISGIDTPDSGEILFEDVPVHHLSNEEISIFRRQKIGLVFQNFNLIPSWTALENVESALLNNNMSEEEKRSRAAEILSGMELGDRLDNLPRELSIGQQQRVALARALINDPGLILADEPTGSVDDVTARDMLAILIPYIRKRKGAMIVTTHGSFQAVNHADTLYLLKDGILIPEKGRQDYQSY